MIIGIVPDPLNHPDWHKMKAFLEPAAKFGDRPVLKPLEVVWAVYHPGLVGCAVTGLKTDGTGEVSLVGGRDHRSWIGALDDMIAAWMQREGMTAVRAYGRKGWRRVLSKWNSMELDDGMTGYERAL